MDALRRKAVLHAGAGAIILSVAGFGVLVLMYALTSYPEHLRGLFSYLSATLGDGLLLPVACGALIFAYNLTTKIRYDFVILLAGFTLGAGVGAATQVAWLLDNHPQLNWTLPRPHYFNAAGTYHAIFLIIASGIFAALWLSVLLRLARGPTPKAELRDSWIAVSVAILAGVLFVGCLISDNRSSMTTAAGVASLAATLFGILGITGLVITVLVVRSRSFRARFHSD